MEKTENIGGLNARIERLDKRVDLFLWINSALACVVLASVALSLTVLWGDKREISTLSQTNYDLTVQVTKLRAELGVAEALTQSMKGALRGADRSAAVTEMQSTADRYALEALKANGASVRTRDETRREVCGLLAGRHPCEP